MDQLSRKHHALHTTGTPKCQREAETHHEHGRKGRGTPIPCAGPH